MKPEMRHALIIFVAMLITAIVTLLVHPNIRLVDQSDKIELETMIPHQLGEWVMDERQSAAVVNPQGGELQNKIYQQVLSRTYIHTPSQRSVMLSIAYGENQNRSNDLHVPDVCYPAGGFKIEFAKLGLLQTKFGDIPVKRLVAQRMQRREPLTYWAIIGEHVATGAVSSKMIALSYGLSGIVPDGIIFRVSSVGIDDEAAFVTQQEFVQVLFDALPATARKRLAGLQ
jgi:EpsI family protein